MTSFLKVDSLALYTTDASNTLQVLDEARSGRTTGNEIDSTLSTAKPQFFERSPS